MDLGYFPYNVGILSISCYPYHIIHTWSYGSGYVQIPMTILYIQLIVQIHDFRVVIVIFIAVIYRFLIFRVLMIMIILPMILYFTYIP